MAKQATAQAQVNPINRIQKFAAETKLEMSKVTWLTKEELKGQTSVVITLLIILAILVGLGDKVFAELILAILKFAA